MTAKLYANFKLEKTFKGRFLNALRSGKYKQIRDELFNQSLGGYCCLGVMCSLRGIKNRELEGVCFPQDIASFDTAFNIDPTTHDFFHGIYSDESAWKVPYRGRMRPLNELNDLEELTFKQIANIIDRSVQTY